MNRLEFVKNAVTVAALSPLSNLSAEDSNNNENQQKLKMIIVNGSPRKNGNTISMLNKVAEGAKDAGCETKIVHLRDIKFTGCLSCLACKVKGNKTNGLCALRDELRPILEETLASDILVLGSPIYYHSPSAFTRAFMERLLFAPLDYYNNPGSSVLTKKIQNALVLTMHVMNDELFNSMNYSQVLGASAKAMELLGPSEKLYLKGLSVFPNHEKYLMSKHFGDILDNMRKEHFDEYQKQAYELGQRLVEKCKF